MNNYRTILLTFALVLTATGCTSLQTEPNGPAPVSNAVGKEIGRMAVRAPSAPNYPHQVWLSGSFDKETHERKGARWLSDERKGPSWLCRLHRTLAVLLALQMDPLTAFRSLLDLPR